MTPRLLTLTQAAETVQWSYTTLLREIKAGNLVARRLSPHGRIRIHPADLDAWVESKRVEVAS